MNGLSKTMLSHHRNVFHEANMMRLSEMMLTLCRYVCSCHGVLCASNLFSMCVSMHKQRSRRRDIHVCVCMCVLMHICWANDAAHTSWERFSHILVQTLCAHAEFRHITTYETLNLKYRATYRALRAIGLPGSLAGAAVNKSCKLRSCKAAICARRRQRSRCMRRT
jgi:hypothetical protein